MLEETDEADVYIRSFRAGAGHLAHFGVQGGAGSLCSGIGVDRLGRGMGDTLLKVNMVMSSLWEVTEIIFFVMGSKLIVVTERKRVIFVSEEGHWMSFSERD